MRWIIEKKKEVIGTFVIVRRKAEFESFVVLIFFVNPDESDL